MWNISEDLTGCRPILHHLTHGSWTPTNFGIHVTPGFNFLQLQGDYHMLLFTGAHCFRQMVFTLKSVHQLWCHKMSTGIQLILHMEHANIFLFLYSFLFFPQFTLDPVGIILSSKCLLQESQSGDSLKGQKLGRGGGGWGQAGSMLPRTFLFCLILYHKLGGKVQELHHSSKSFRTNGPRKLVTNIVLTMDVCNNAVIEMVPSANLRNCNHFSLQ